MTSKDRNRQEISKLHLLLPLLIVIPMLAVGCASIGGEQALPVDQNEQGSARQSDKSDDQLTEDSGAIEQTDCLDGEDHPLAAGIAEEYEVDYETIVTWFCQGNTFDDILLALQTSTMTDTGPEDLLTMLDGMTWEEIWDELGVTSLESNQ